MILFKEKRKRIESRRYIAQVAVLLDTVEIITISVLIQRLLPFNVITIKALSKGTVFHDPISKSKEKESKAGDIAQVVVLFDTVVISS